MTIDTSEGRLLEPCLECRSHVLAAFAELRDTPGGLTSGIVPGDRTALMLGLCGAAARVVHGGSTGRALAYEYARSQAVVLAIGEAFK